MMMTVFALFVLSRHKMFVHLWQLLRIGVMNMKKTEVSARALLFTLLLLVVTLPYSVGAQNLLKDAGKNVDEIVPSGWEHIEAVGDLNKDGIADLVVSATPDFREHIRVRDDGYEYNFNQPVLGIYFGTGGGEFRCWKQYNNVMPAQESEQEMLDCVISITDRGTLRIAIGRMYSAGSSYHSTDSYIFRYQNDDFFLIGKESDSFSRMSGEQETVSYNYLTGKVQTVKGNVFDESVQPVETWKRIGKSPLRPMGDPL